MRNNGSKENDHVVCTHVHTHRDDSSGDGVCGKCARAR